MYTKSIIYNKKEDSTFSIFFFACISHIFFHRKRTFIYINIFLRCFGFICSMFHVMLNRKLEINQLLKFLKNTCKVAHFIFAAGL